MTSTNHHPSTHAPPPVKMNNRSAVKKKNRICKHVTNFKTSPFPLPTEVINVWTLIRSILKM